AGLAYGPEQWRTARRPARARRALAADGGGLAGRTELAHVLQRDDALEVELLRDARVDQLDRPPTGDEAADLLERSLRRREPDALERRRDETLEPLEGERQMRAALRAGDGVHLVEQQRVDRTKKLVRLRGQHQEQRLGRRDQDVRRLAKHPCEIGRASCR